MNINMSILRGAAGALVLGSFLTNMAQAASIKKNNDAAVADQTWANLRTVLINAVDGDTIKVSGNFQRTAGDADGGLTISAPNVKFSGGWNADFTVQAWAAKTVFTNEFALYSVLDVNGSDTANNQYRVLLLSGTGVTVEGFTVTKGYLLVTAAFGTGGGGIKVDGTGALLRHLNITANIARRLTTSDGPSALEINATGARAEYIAVVANKAEGTTPRSAGLVVSENARNGAFMLANSIISANTAGANCEGLGLVFRGPDTPTLVQHWTVFGTLVYGHTQATDGAIQLRSAEANGRANLVNTTVADNSSPVRIRTYSNFTEWYMNYFINSIVADSVKIECSNGSLATSRAYFKNTLIDPETPAAGGMYFDGSVFVDLGGNFTDKQPLFTNPTGRDYTLQTVSSAYTNAAVLYSSSGLGFAYVDVDRNNSYNAGVDVIVHIVSGAGQYPPAALEYYYPTDIQGNRWLTRKRYASNADLVGTMNMGSYAPPPPPGGTVITLR